MINAYQYSRIDNKIYSELSIPTVEEDIKKYAKKHEKRLHNHTNVDSIQPLDNGYSTKRLNRLHPADLLTIVLPIGHM